ncbi:MAG TPA: ATP-dependent DNA helicase RecQ [Chloroflexota bacterium]|nr:ATP-dependent DNA helicase RecQ [Chloroflexota bacterium]
MALQRYFGFAAFRAGQEEIVRRAVAGRDTLALMPTGAGKSLCYQLAAMLRPSPTLVISPLIALMKDQVDNLPPAIAEQATLINSTLEQGEAARRVQALAQGQYKLLYAAPERLRQRNFVAALRSVEIGLVVIDEVHCVSMWGHDFRPDYMFIRSALEDLGNPSILGLTATATPGTERDIALSLGRDLDVVRASVQRPNLRFEVEHVESEDDRQRAMLERVRALPGSGIIYARAREKCERLAALLQRSGVNALHYHARLEPAERGRVQDRFLQGSARVVVATTAFGMGIDKADIRWVVLYNFPNSLESYVQMVGRAGRDGAPSTCALFAGDADAKSLLRFAQTDLPSIEQLRAVYAELKRQSIEGGVEITPEELGTAAGLKEDVDPRVFVGMLERADLARRRYDAGRAMRIDLLPPPPDTSRRIGELLRRYEEQAHDRARRMIAFADVERCRHLQVAEHFGETAQTPCAMCDVCAPTAAVQRQRAAAPPLPKDLARAILDAVDSLAWPVGERGLAAMLSGAVDAPPSAQRSDSYGLLTAARPAKVKRWVSQLIEHGNLEHFESRDGYRLLRVARRSDLPQLELPVLGRSERSPLTGTAAGSAQDREPATEREALRQVVEASPEATALYEQLRLWRLDQAKANGVAAFVVLTNTTLYEIAIRRPASSYALGNIYGIGKQKLEQWGEAILALVRSTPTSTALAASAERWDEAILADMPQRGN